MKNSKDLFDEFMHRLHGIDHPDELRSMAMLVLEHVYGITRTALMTNKSIPWEQPEQLRWDDVIHRLLQHEPVQYVTGVADFYGYTFAVNPHVLIPRPETEELVSLVLAHISALPQPRIVDAGTGSGCIPITIALQHRGADVYGLDISSNALQVARENGARLQAPVTWITHDILSDPWPISGLDVLVSNPPYIAQYEQATMAPRVVNHEPHLALFVPDNDPLVFYQALAQHGTTALLPGGMLAVEINERLGHEVASCWNAHGYTQTEILNDLQGKARMVRGFRPIS